MNAQDCLAASATVCACYGFDSFDAMKTVVIDQGYLNWRGAPISRLHWSQVEKAFHTAQFLKWAAEAEGPNGRGYWIGAAAKRLPPMSAERWRGLPDALKAASFA